jgi:putative PIG3 family NAD(P)H quinone oxidoreductase
VQAIVFAGAGGNEVVRLEERKDPVPGTQEVLIAVSYAGLNQADLAQREGRYPAPPGAPEDIPGLEVAGVVVGRGSAVTAWSEGDRVFGIVGGGGLADRVVVHERHLARVPERLDEAGAAAVPEAFITAHDALVTQAGLGLGDTLLVNGANGGVGTAAIQIGRAAGALVFGSIRSKEAKERVASLGAEPVGSDEFVQHVRDAGGADIVLELVGASNLDSDLDALALRGRIVVVGVAGGIDGSLPVWKLMRRRARLIGTVLRGRSLEDKAAAVQAFAHDLVPLLADGRIEPVVDRVFPATEVAEAFDYLERPGKFGRVLLAF